MVAQLQKPTKRLCLGSASRSEGIRGVVVQAELRCRASTQMSRVQSYYKRCCESSIVEGIMFAAEDSECIDHVVTCMVMRTVTRKAWRRGHEAEADDDWREQQRSPYCQ